MMVSERYILSREEETICQAIVHASITVHKELGPGLLEKIYELCLAEELKNLGFHVERQVTYPVHYKNQTFEEGLRLDILVEKSILCEVKAVELVNPVWSAQVLSQLKLSHLHIGFLLNFNVPIMKQGIRRFTL